MKRTDSKQLKQRLKLIAQGLLLALSASLLGCVTTSTVPPAKAETATPDPVTIQEAMDSGDEAVRKNKLELALFHYVQALSIDPTLTEAFYKIGVIHDALGNTDLAEKAYRDVLKQNESHAGALEGLGLLQLRQKEYRLAKKIWRQQLRSIPNAGNPIVALALLLILTRITRRRGNTIKPP